MDLKLQGSTAKAAGGSFGIVLDAIGSQSGTALIGATFHLNGRKSRAV